MLFKQQSYIWDRSATLQTDCIANQIAMSDLEFYDISELRMLNSGHMTYDEFKNNTVIRFVRKYYELFENQEWNNKAQRYEGFSIAGAMLDIYDLYVEYYKSETKAYQALSELLFPGLSNFTEIESWSNTIIMIYDKIISKLVDSVCQHADEYHVTKVKADNIRRDLLNYHFGSIRTLFKTIIPAMYSNKRCLFDGNRVGLGSVLFSLSVNKHNSYARNLQGWRDGLLDFSFNDSMLYYLTNYDITVVSHGDDMIVSRNDWDVHPVKTPYTTGTFRSVSKLIQSLLQTSNCRRINILACNPNKSRLYAELYKEDNCYINIHEGNVIIG